MSFTSPFSRQIQLDKDLGIDIPQSNNGEQYDDDFYDQYLKFESDDSSMDLDPLDCSTKPSSTSSEKYLVCEITSNESVGNTNKSHQPWQSNCFENSTRLAPTLTKNQRFIPASQGSILAFYRESTGRAAISDTGLLSLGEMSLYPLHPTSSTPPPSPSTSSLPGDKHFTNKKLLPTFSIKNPRINSSANVSLNMRSSSARSGSLPLLSEQQNLSGSNIFSGLGVPVAGIPSSPPPSAAFPEFNNNAMIIDPKPERLDDNLKCQHISSQQSLLIHEAQSSSALRTSTASNLRNEGRAGNQPSDARFPIDLASENWITQPASTNYAFGEGSQAGSLNQAGQLWWAAPPTTGDSQPSPAWSNVEAQKASQNLNLHLSTNSFIAMDSTNGLMIHLQGQPSLQLGQAARAVAEDELYYTPAALGPAPIASCYSPNKFGSPALSPNSLPSRAPKGQPRKNPRSRSRSPSPTNSPLLSSPRKSPAAKTPRRKGPSTKNRQSSSDFVNWGPQDSKQILGGVAPSGSSKTKARREREATEHREKWMAGIRRLISENGSGRDLQEFELR
ncbi:MAG: hypothetical protein M1829_004400 [Trizodia sp. TS-e1964]|nr:MAG: hypothetical protein M1829_004400 [Trizodia sp. TS-e1964]